MLPAWQPRPGAPPQPSRRPRRAGTPARRSGRPQRLDALLGELRRAGCCRSWSCTCSRAGRSYGNQLIERIPQVTAGGRGQPEHDVPAPARPRGAGARRRGVGAPGAPLAPLLRAHDGGRSRARAPARGRGAAARCGRARGRAAAGSWPARLGPGRERLSRRSACAWTCRVRTWPPRALWYDLARWPSFVEGFSTSAGRRGLAGRARWSGTRARTAAAA